MGYEDSKLNRLFQGHGKNYEIYAYDSYKSKVFFIVTRPRTTSLTSPRNEKICIVSFILSVGYQVTKIVILLNIGNDSPGAKLA